MPAGPHAAVLLHPGGDLLDVWSGQRHPAVRRAGQGPEETTDTECDVGEFVDRRLLGELFGLVDNVPQRT